MLVAGLLVFRPNQPASRRAPAETAAVLVATRAIPALALLRDGDLGWRDMPTKSSPPGSLARGKATPSQFLGALTRRPLAAGEIVLGGDLIAPGDRRFLAAVLSPGMGAVTLPVDFAQSAAGLILPDDHVDVILVQDPGSAAGPGAEGSRGSVAQILLRDIRVVAVDRVFERVASVGGAGSLASSAASAASTSSADATPPRTLTLEVNDRDAQKVFLAEQVGKVQFTLRALARPEFALTDAGAPVWGSDVTPAGLARIPAPLAIAAPDRAAIALGPRPVAVDDGGGATGGSAIRIVRGSRATAP